MCELGRQNGDTRALVGPTVSLLPFAAALDWRFVTFRSMASSLYIPKEGRLQWLAQRVNYLRETTVCRSTNDHLHHT
jgi:hypothetical protein